MSSGGSFQLLANDGKSDRLILATEFLNARINAITCARRKAGEAVTSPTIVDIEKTHVLFVNHAWKPFAATAFEYNKVRPNTGTVGLGGTVQFSIPQFGEFFGDMVMRARVGAVTAAEQPLPLQGTAAFPVNTATDYYNLVDATGALVVQGQAVPIPPVGAYTYHNFLRYCEFPANRLCLKVSFEVNGNPLDYYTADTSAMLEKFTVNADKRAGYNTLAGQQNSHTGYSGPRRGQLLDADAANTPAGIWRADSGQSNQTVAPYDPAVYPTATVPLNSAVGQYDIVQEQKQFTCGAQTPKPALAPLEIWHKLKFWFNKDVRDSIASVSIPQGQRFITIDTNSAENLIYESCNLYLQHIHEGPNPQATFNSKLPASSSSLVTTALGTLRTVTYTPIASSLSAANRFVAQPTVTYELYINNIFVNPEIHDIFIERISFSLVRCYRQHIQQVTESANEIQLTQLKWPIEYMFIGFRPNYNVSNLNLDQWHDWHRFTRQINVSVPVESVGATPGGAFAVALASSYAPVVPDHFWQAVPTINTMKLNAHGNTLYDYFQDIFYHSYVPTTYGGANIITPGDEGALMINMAFFAGSHQPSGHLNLSRARETFICYTSSYISSKTPAQMTVIGIALNFLLIEDGSAVLRFST